MNKSSKGKEAKAPPPAEGANPEDEKKPKKRGNRGGGKKIYRLIDANCSFPNSASFDPDAGSFDPRSASFDPLATSFRMDVPSYSPMAYAKSLLDPWAGAALLPDSQMGPIVLDTIKWTPTVTVPASGAGCLIYSPNLLTVDHYEEISSVLVFKETLPASKIPSNYYTQYRVVSGGLKCTSNTVSASSTQVEGALNLACAAQLPDYKSLNFSNLPAFGWGGSDCSTSGGSQQGVVGVYVPMGTTNFKVFTTSGQSDSSAALYTISNGDSAVWNLNPGAGLNYVQFTKANGLVPANALGATVISVALNYSAGLASSKSVNIEVVREVNAGSVTKVYLVTMETGVQDSYTSIYDNEPGKIVSVALRDISGQALRSTGSDVTQLSVQWLDTNPASLQPAIACYYDGFGAGTKIKVDAVANYEAILDSAQAQASSGTGMKMRISDPMALHAAQLVAMRSPKAFPANAHSELKRDLPQAASFLEILDRVANGLDKGLDVYRYARQNNGRGSL
jgi:hypothetical protein